MTRRSPHRRRQGLWLYRLGLRAFPKPFRDRYGEEMVAAFERALEAAREEGEPAVFRVWVRGLSDAALHGLARRHAHRRRSVVWSRGMDPGAGDVMQNLVVEVRQSIRAMLRRPMLYGTALVTLAVGIGANTGIFSVVNALLIRPLPYEAADRLVVVWAENQALGWRETDVSLPDAWEYRDRTDALADLAVFDDREGTVTGGPVPERVQVVEATPNLFSVLGVQPALGRDFSSGDAAAGASLAAIVSEAYRARRFGVIGGLGEELVLDGEAATIVGVMGRDFAFLDEVPDVWVARRGDPQVEARGSHDHEAIARLAANVDVAGAERALNEVAAAQASLYPDTNDGWTVDVQLLRNDLLGDVARRAVLVLLGAVGFVLIMACTNIANLLLARSDGRKQEMAVRRALGASRTRLIRQLMIESVVLAAVGGGLGVMLGYWLERWIVAGLPDSLPPAFQFGLDGTVLFFSALAAVIAALMFGLVPALRGSRTAVEELRRGGAGRAGVTSGFGSFLIVMQTALAMVLLVGGGMMTRSLLELMKQDMGFEAEGVLTMRFSAPEARYPDDDALRRFWDDAMASLASIPGVESVGAIQSLPLGGDNWGATFWLEGQEDPASDQGRASRLEYISHDYPGAMGLDIIAGRGFETADNGSSPGVALVTESFARAHFAGTDVLGTRLLSSGLRVPVTIVGVVEDHLSRGIDRAAEPALLLSLEQRPLRSRAVAVRTRGDAADLADVVRATIRTIDAEVPVYDVRTMRERVTSSVGSFALLAELMGGFALTSLLLGAIGIYGVTAYAVARRSAEIGIRMALGATASSVTWLVIGQGARRIAFGLVLGTVLALLLARSMRAILFNVSPTDPVTLTSVGLVLAALGLLGSWLPARKASRLDPASTLSSRSG